MFSSASRRRQRRRYIQGARSIADQRAAHAGDFAELVALIRTSGTDSIRHFQNGYTREGGLYLQQNPDELAALILLLREHRPLPRYLEVGSASGGTCLILQQQVGFERVLSIDDGQHPRAVEQDRLLGAVPHCLRHLGDSHAEPARRFLQENVQGRLDVAFIDGDHSYEGVWQDLELTLPFCRPGTLLILHDTVACSGVERAWIRLAREKRAQPIAEFIGAQRPLGIGVARTP
jgi:predicted O-methyltransferase YrrM